MWSADPAMQHTDDNPTGLMLFSDRFATLYDYLETRPGKLSKFYPKPDTPVTNLKALRELLLSKDLSRN